MGKWRAVAGLSALFFAVAVHASPDASLTVSRETRAVFGDAIIDFADKNIVNQPALPVISAADCGTDGKVSPSFRVQFTHPTWTADKACNAFAEANWKGAGGRYDFTDGNIILMLDLAGSEHDVTKMSGLTFPGTEEDWNTFLLFHELQHSRDHINGTRVAETTEYYADLGAREYYNQALQQGLVTNPGVPDAMRGMRVIEDISNPLDENRHNIALLAGLPEIDLHADNAFKTIVLSLSRARTLIYQSMGSQSPHDPHLLYESARNLYLNGAFDNDPVQKAYAREFIRAAETYGADYYRTRNSHTLAPSLSPGS